MSDKQKQEQIDDVPVREGKVTLEIGDAADNPAFCDLRIRAHPEASAYARAIAIGLAEIFRIEPELISEFYINYMQEQGYMKEEDTPDWAKDIKGTA